ncbi:MAG: MATE family efflux transporter [Clostridia bacterium]|nr:MATE family efflux transporter [Clostridia bacterium]
MSIQLSEHFTYKKLLKFTLPSVAMMIFTSIYGVVDGFFVSNFAGDIPFKAVNLIMPFLMIFGTVGFIFGTGGTAIVAKTLGEGDISKANRYFSLFVYVTFSLGLFFAVLGIAFLRPIAAFLGATGEILESCVIYGRIILLALPFLVLQFLFQSFFVAAEKPRMGLFVILAAGITNMVLDAVLVTLLPHELKLTGAALATASSQFVGGFVPLVYFLRKNPTLFRIGKTKFDFCAIGHACVNGSSEFMNNISMSIVGMLYNKQLLHYAGEDGIAAYGVMMYVSFIFAAVFIGYSIGTAPVISYHYGAGNHRELKGILKKSLILLGICSVFMLIFAEFLATPLAKIFVSYSDSLMEMTVHGFRIFAVSFLFMGFAIFSSGFFTALNDGVTSAVISFLRTVLFQIAAVLLLPLIWDLDGVWISVVTAEMMAVVFSFLFLMIKRKKFHY